MVSRRRLDTRRPTLTLLKYYIHSTVTREREKRAAGQQLHNDSTDLPITRLTGFTEQKSARDYTTSHNR